MVSSSLGTFLGQNHTLQILGMSNWLTWNLASFTDQLLAVLKCKIFLIFKMFLVSPERYILWPWNFPKYVSSTKKVDWLKYFLLLLKLTKTGFWSVNYTPVTWHNQWCHQSPSFHNGVAGTNSNFIPCLEVDMSGKMYTVPPVHTLIRKSVYPRRVKMFSDLSPNWSS